MNVLGIETSCDETAAAIVRDGGSVLANVVASQFDVHEAYGGVVPELAARRQLTAIMPVVWEALDQASIGLGEIDAIAVTRGPGLAGSLLVGANFAKTLAYARDLPLVAVNHLEAHIYANWLNRRELNEIAAPGFPLLCLLVSGGHTELIRMTGHGKYEHLGRTLDDAAGEAFDKGARLLGLGFPGGPAIQQAAAGVHSEEITLPRAWLPDTFDFSFSGLKTALLREVEPFRLPSEPAQKEDLPFARHQPPRYRKEMPVAELASAFQQSVVEVLAVKTARAARTLEISTVILAGGVAANQLLRERLHAELDGNAIVLHVPVASFCTDNAAMVAAAGYFSIRRGDQAGWEFDVAARLPLSDRSGEAN